MRNETIGNYIRSWLSFSGYSLPQVRDDEDTCEHCIKGRCVLRWGLTWLATTFIIMSIIFGYRWISGDPVKPEKNIASEIQ